MSPHPLLKPSRCKGPNCGAPIAWAMTTAGKLIPLDLEPDELGNITITDRTGRTQQGTEVAIVEVAPSGQGHLGLDVDAARYMPHHATCPDVDQFR